MKVKLLFKNKSGLRVVINDARDNTPDTRPVGERNSASTAGMSVVGKNTHGLLQEFEKQLSRVLGIMENEDAEELGFATRGFTYDYEELNSFRNLLISTKHFIDKNMEDLRTEGITDPFYRDEVIIALTDYLNYNIENIDDLKSNLSIREYNKLLKDMTAKEELTVDEVVDKINSKSKSGWTDFYKKFKQKQYINEVPDIERANKPVKAVRGEGDHDFYLLDEHGNRVLHMDMKNKSVRAFASTDESDYDEDIDYDNVGETSDFNFFFGGVDSDEEDLGEEDLEEEDLEEEDLDVEDLDVEDLEEEDLELHLEDSIDVYSDIMHTILSDRDLTRFVGRASKSAKSKLALLNDAKNLYELFEEKFGKRPAGVGKRIGSTYEYYLVDADGNNIGIVNQQTREVRDLSEVQIENNDPLDAALELVKNNPEHSNFNEDDESGYVELPDGNVIAIFYTDETNYLALNLNEAEEFLYSDSIKKYIGLFNNFQDYLDGQMPNIKREVR